jgi:hypothetical protein
VKTLFVGDVHAKVEDLADCRALLDLVDETAKKHVVDRTVFLGDQYHQHAIVNVEVQRFWLEQFDRLRAPGRDIVALVGNHDRPGDKTATAHAMQVHRHQVTVVDEPTVIDGVLYLPYFHDQTAFVAAAKAHPECDTLVCHATFNGARYDNGFYAKEALEPDAVPQKRIISGHIHTPASFNKVWYPGSPRWQTTSDANISRAIWVEDDAPGGMGYPVDTGKALRVIWQLTDTEGDEGPSVSDLVEQKVKDGDRVVINLQGAQAWCAQRKRDLASLRPNIRFRTFYTDGHSAKVRESDGVAAAFRKHFDAYQTKHGTSKDVLSKMVEERVHLA